MVGNNMYICMYVCMSVPIDQAIHNLAIIRKRYALVIVKELGVNSRNSIDKNGYYNKTNPIMEMYNQ